MDVFYLKSLSLEVIFSSRLEMWYEPVAMLVLLAVSLLLADCAQCVCVCVCSGGLSLSPAACLTVLSACLGTKWLLFASCCALAAFFLSTATVASGALSLVCLNGSPVLSAEGRG